MSLFSFFRRKPKGYYVPDLLREYAQSRASGMTHEATGLAMLDRHLGLTPERIGTDDESIARIAAMLRFMVNTLHKPDWFCLFVDLCLCRKLQRKLRECIFQDEAYFDRLGAFFFMGALFSDISVNHLTKRDRGKGFTENEASEMIEAAYWSTILAPAFPMGWLPLAECAQYGIRFDGDERDHVSGGIQACEASVAFFRDCGITENEDVILEARELFRQLNEGG